MDPPADELAISPHCKVQGWWIGVTLKLKRGALKQHGNDLQLAEYVEGTIHDYDSVSGNSQIWIHRKDNSATTHCDAICVDHINLQDSSLQYECTRSITDNASDLAIPSTKDWIPMKLDIGCFVEVRHCNLHPLVGVIDGYDEGSRRYHISYDDAQCPSEWMWCTNSNTSLRSQLQFKFNLKLKAIINTNNTSTPITFPIALPPPFKPVIYKLDPSFLDVSRQMARNSKRVYRGRSEDEPAAKRRKVNIISPPAQRIPKMTEKMTTCDSSTIDLTVNEHDTASSVTTVPMNNSNMEGSHGNNPSLSNHSNPSNPSSNADILALPPPHSRRTVIDLVDVDAERDQEIVVGTAQHREYERRLRRRKKEERKLRKKRKRFKSKSRSKGSSLYPRKARIEGRKWKRAYSVTDRRYYWTRKERKGRDDQLVSSWNPWKDHGQIAPWLQGRSVWEKWTDEESKRKYYFNPLTRESTFVRPADYRSLDEIDHDSMEDDEYKEIEPALDSLNDPEIEVVGVSRPRNSKRSDGRIRESERPKANSRRNNMLDPHAGGFNFYDLPQNEESATTKHKEVRDDSLQRAAHGLSSIFGVDGTVNVNVDSLAANRESEKGGGVGSPGSEERGKSVSATATEREDSVKSIDLDSIFATNGDRELLAKYRREDIVRAWWRELEPKVRAEPKIKFNELIATHAVALNLDLDEQVINDLKNEYNQTVVDIFQSSATNLATLDMAQSARSGHHIFKSCAPQKAPQSVWALLVENLQSPYKSQNVEALEFVLKVLEVDDEGNESENDGGGGDDDESKIPKNVESHCERRAKCLSILTQNSDALVTILNSDRGHFVDYFTRILCLILPDRDDIGDGDGDRDDEAVDAALKVFGFRFASDYMFAMMRHSLKNTEIIHMISLMARKCIVYQLAGCHRLEQLLKKYNILALLTAKRWRSSKTKRKRRRQAEDDKSVERERASKQLAMEVLSLVVTLSKGIGSYPPMTPLMDDVIDEVEQNREEMLFNGFPLDLLLETVSAVLEWNLNASKPNVKVFELCCDILVNVVAVDGALIFKLLSSDLRRSKRIIFVLHKTYGDIAQFEERLRRYYMESGNGNGNIMDITAVGRKHGDELNDDPMGDSKRVLIDDDDAMISGQLRVIQPYALRAGDDASWEPYGVTLDVSQREDGLKLSNVDCRRSIGDVLLRHIDFIANYQGQFSDHPLNSTADLQRRWQLGIGRVFYEALSNGHLVKVSWGFNKALNHYHRSNGAMEWVTAELLYQHAIDGRQHPDRHDQPRRHFRICWLLQTLFDPLVWDYTAYSELLEKLCVFCMRFRERTGVELVTWRKLKLCHSSYSDRVGAAAVDDDHNDNDNDHKKNKKNSNLKKRGFKESDFMNHLISNLWNEVVAKCKAVMVRMKQNQNQNQQDRGLSIDSTDSVKEDETKSVSLKQEEVALLETLSECVFGVNLRSKSDSNLNPNQKASSIDVGGMVAALEEMVRSKGRSILNARSAATGSSTHRGQKRSIDDLVSMVLRSNTLHFLVGLTQMEATCGDTRNVARRAIRAVVWSVDRRRKRLLKKGQIPFLPTISWCYREWDVPSQHDDQFVIGKEQSVLVVGDGNLSFGRALCRLFGAPSTKSKLTRYRAKKERETNNGNGNHDTNTMSDSNNININMNDSGNLDGSGNVDGAAIDCGARNIVVTAYESAMELLSRYPHSGSVVAEIVDRGGLVLYGIDATDLASTLSASYRTYGGDKRPLPLFADESGFESFLYDVIVWNFPHAMDDAFKPGVNGDLVEQFLVSAQRILAKNGQIHVTLHINHQIDHEVGSAAAQSRVYPQFTSWRIGERAHRQHLRCINRIDLNHRRYPGYAIKNVQGNPFNIVKAETYIFQRAEDCNL